MSEIVLEHPLPWEKIELIIKRHWIVYAFIWVYFFNWLLLSSALIFFFFSKAIIYIILIMFWMAFILFLYVKWLDHELDLFIVTNNRIIWIEQISLLNRTVSECSLSQVQEVWSQTQWFFANVLNYWKITIQTAWNVSNFIMEFAPDAIDTSSKIHNIINTFRDNFLKKKNVITRDLWAREIEIWAREKVQDIITQQ